MGEHLDNQDICKICREKHEEPCCEGCPLNISDEDIFSRGERVAYNPQKHFPADN